MKLGSGSAVCSTILWPGALHHPGAWGIGHGAWRLLWPPETSSTLPEPLTPKSLKTCPLPCEQVALDVIASVRVAAWGDPELEEVRALLEAQLREVGPGGAPGTTHGF